MGDVIVLAERRARRQTAAAVGAGPRRLTFYFDLASPYTYLAAERVDRLFGDIDWCPAIGDALHGGDPIAEVGERERALAAAESRAVQLGMPLVWPERYPAAGRAAMRVAAVAAQERRAAPFVLAASRLAFCGGFDLDDPETLAEAAAAASLPLDRCLKAAKDRALDEPMERHALRLLAQGADRLPVVCVGRILFAGEHRIAEAAALARSLGPAEAQPTPTVG